MPLVDSPRVRTLTAPVIVGAATIAWAIPLALIALAGEQAVDVRAAAVLGVLMNSVVAGVGLVATRSARRRSAGVEADVWRYIGYGLSCWCLGIVPYATFVAIGGDVSNPAAWSQIGFLAAYPFWYRALWILRQPAIGEARRQRIETWAIELSVLVLFAVIVFSLVWYPGTTWDRNTALLVPVLLDLLLLGLLYNAVRRSRVTHRSAMVWFAYAFAVLGLTDGLITYLLPRASKELVGVVLAGYLVAMALMVVAARRPLRVTEAQAMMGPSNALLATIGLALTGPATALLPAVARPAIWVVALLLLWRLSALLRRHGQSDTDPLTGFLEQRAFLRHVGGVVQAASTARPALLVAVDLDGFGRWNAQHGYGAGDRLLTRLAADLEGSALRGGLWSRLGADRFAWIGIGPEPEEGRRLAEIAQAIASDNEGGLTARATVVVLPLDAENAANALAAAEEGLAAARAGRRRIVAFDRGRLDGVEYTAGYTASLAQRREAILEVLHAPQTISTVFQPIVSLADGRTVGFESLSRFRAEPQRPPDRWIAEAHAVGLGLEIEVECVRRAMALRHTLPDSTYLSVNMSPDAILAPEMEDALGDGDLAGLVIEITEHEAVGDYARLSSRLADYRGRGALVAIDDAGAGHASMRHVTQLNPDYIKIDRSLIHDIHLDHAKRALVRSMVTLEKELGAAIVAEGIESAEELGTLRSLGVPFGQGYLLARPASSATPAPWSGALLALAEPAVEA
jgi:diguanylate cyclase (GGDEF)-like protein